MIRIKNEDIPSNVPAHRIMAIHRAVAGKIQEWIGQHKGFPKTPTNAGFFLLDSLTQSRGTEVNFSFSIRNDESTGQPELAVTIHYIRLAETAEEVQQIKNEMSSAPNFKLHPNPHLN